MTVPQKDNPVVKVLLKKLKAEYDLEFVPVIAESEYPVNNCFLNVEEYVSKNGGNIFYGWQIWETPFLVEAEAHAVVENDDGDLIDVTPKNIECSRILFLPDDRWVYEGKQIDNIRINKSKNKLVDLFIKAFETKFRVENKGDRANQHLIVISTPRENLIYDVIKEISFYLDNELELDSVCPCGSKRKIKNCHGYDIFERINNCL